MQSYGSSDIVVAIYEDNPPHYIIALSTGTSGQKLVLSAENSQPCPVESGTATGAPCEPQRIPFADLEGTTLDDTVIGKAFERHQQAGYPKELIKIKQETSGGRLKFYLTQSSLYEQPGANLRWRILDAIPSGRSASDSIEKGDALFPALIVVALFGFAICLGFAAVFFRKRKERAVILADWRFACAFVLGCALFNTSTLTLLGPNTDELCMLRMWSFHGLFAVALSPLFVKVWRIWRLVGHADRFRRAKMSNTTTAVWALPLILIQALILLFISLFDPPRRTDETDVREGVTTQVSFRVRCSLVPVYAKGGLLK